MIPEDVRRILRFRANRESDMETINNVNKALGPRFITKYGTREGLLVLGKQIPLGLGR